MKDLEKVRVDKWLWSVRIFKSRSLASDKCKRGKVKVNGKIVKASAEIKVDDIIEVEKNKFNLSFHVIGIIKKRVGAPIAQEQYKDLTPESEYRKFEKWYVGKKNSEYRDPGAGRPTKKERRQMDDFKDQFPF